MRRSLLMRQELYKHIRTLIPKNKMRRTGVKITNTHDKIQRRECYGGCMLNIVGVWNARGVSE
jgi:hypothetical protein